MITRKTLEKLLSVNPRTGIITKSDLVFRDVELFKKFKNLNITILVSILDEDIKILK